MVARYKPHSSPLSCIDRRNISIEYMIFHIMLTYFALELTIHQYSSRVAVQPRFPRSSSGGTAAKFDPPLYNNDGQHIDESCWPATAVHCNRLGVPCYSPKFFGASQLPTGLRELQSLQQSVSLASTNPPTSGHSQGQATNHAEIWEESVYQVVSCHCSGHSTRLLMHSYAAGATTGTITHASLLRMKDPIHMTHGGTRATRALSLLLSNYVHSHPPRVSGVWPHSLLVGWSSSTSRTLRRCLCRDDAGSTAIAKRAPRCRET